MTLLRRLLPALFALMAFAAPAPVFAQAPLKAPLVAYIDMREIMRDSAAGKTVQDYFNGKRKALREQIGAEEKKVRAAWDELNRQKSILAPQALQARERSFRELEAAARGTAAKLDQDFARDLRAVQAEFQRVVNEKLNVIFNALMSEKGIDLIVANEAVVMARKEYDVTPDVLKRLNKALPKVDIKALAAKAAAAKAKN